MKKILTIIAMGVLCLCVTSCSDVCEEAYMAELNYKYWKGVNPYSSAAIQYEKEFMELYQGMSEVERRQYKTYRKRMEQEAAQLRQQEETVKAEANAMLNE